MLYYKGYFPDALSSLNKIITEAETSLVEDVGITIKGNSLTRRPNGSRALAKATLWPGPDLEWFINLFLIAPL